MGGYGQAGAERVVQILREELEMTMRLMGVNKIADIDPNSVITRNLQDHINLVPKDYMSVLTYDKIAPPKGRL